jgi:fatty acid desaturase
MIRFKGGIIIITKTISIIITLGIGFVGFLWFLGLRKTETWEVGKNKQQKIIRNVRILHAVVAICAVAYGSAFTLATFWPIHILIGLFFGFPISIVWSSIRVRYSLVSEQTKHSIVPSPVWIDVIFVFCCLILGVLCGIGFNFL